MAQSSQINVQSTALRAIPMTDGPHRFQPPDKMRSWLLDCDPQKGYK